MVDFVLIAAVAIAVLATAMRSVVAPRTNRALRLLALVACVAQVTIEGPRVELLPVYVVAALLTVLAVIDLIRHGRRAPSAVLPAGSRVATFLRWLAASGATLLLLFALLLCVALGRLDYPPPSGAYAVGTGELRLIDGSREETFTESAGDRREILVRASYPAVNDAAFARLPDDTIPGVAALVVSWFWPNAVTIRWGAIRTHAKRDAPLAATQQRYPVLIFSHGMGGYPEQNTALVEHLASHGYVVMAVNHPFLSSGFRFADGSMIGLEMLLGPNPFPNDEQQGLDEQAQRPALANPRYSIAEREALVRQLAAINPRSTERWAGIHRVMSEDQRFLLDSLSSLPVDSVLAGRLDLERIGIFGMSSGGTAAHMTCAEDRRCRAGLNLDGFQPLLIDLPPLETPFMHMSRANVFTNAIAHDRSLAVSYVVRVEGAEHLSFADNVLILHGLKRFGGVGSEFLGAIDAERVIALVNEYALAFFNTSLLGVHDPLLDGSTQRYPEASLVSKVASSSESTRD